MEVISLGTMNRIEKLPSSETPLFLAVEAYGLSDSVHLGIRRASSDRASETGLIDRGGKQEEPGIPKKLLHERHKNLVL